MEGVRFEVRTITAKSFESDVVESDDAWILAVKGTKVSEQKWQTEENQLRGVVNVAFVDLQGEEDFWLKKVIQLRNNRAFITCKLVCTIVAEYEFRNLNKCRPGSTKFKLSAAKQWGITSQKYESVWTEYDYSVGPSYDCIRGP